jgi:phosphomannomutase/phosphoglucomutase
MTANIFRAYDIRGIVDDTVTEVFTYQLGQVLGEQVCQQPRAATAKPQLVVGRDGRLSGGRLAAAFIEGVLSSGCDVLEIGMVPTPVLYFSLFHLQIPHGVMITASHNPANYNGFKIVLNYQAIHGQAIQNLYHALLQARRPVAYQGQRQQQDILTVYQQQLQQLELAPARRLRVVVDCGNGIAGIIAPTLYSELGYEVVPLYCEVDGNFPNHHPDPGDSNNLVALQQAVLAEQADLGLAFDGDGDRLGLVDNQGQIIWADRLLMLLAADMLQRHPASYVLYDVKSTSYLAAFIREHGGQPLMWKTGHSLMKAKMQATGAMLAGEMSGHFFFKERWFGVDDALLAGAKILQILAAAGLPASAVFATLPAAYSTGELSIEVSDADKFTLVQQLIAAASFPEARELILLDGLRVEFAYGWGVVRASNTSPKLIARFEGYTPAALQQIIAVFKQNLLAIRPELRLPF